MINDLGILGTAEDIIQWLVESSHQYDDAICQCGDVMPRAKPDSVIVHRIDMQARSQRKSGRLSRSNSGYKRPGRSRTDFCGYGQCLRRSTGGYIGRTCSQRRN
jgi:hypothetical protein